MTEKVKKVNKKTGKVFVDKENRKKILFYVPTNFYDLLSKAKNNKIENQGYLMNKILMSSMKTTELEDGTFKHSLIINAKEVVSIVNSTPKQRKAMFKRGSKY